MTGMPRHERVDMLLVARALDDLMLKSGVSVPTLLHKAVAERAGLHPTTVLRYHRQEVASASIKVLDCVEELERSLERGDPLFCRAGGPGTTELKVGSPMVRYWTDRVAALLELRSRRPLFRYVAVVLGIHPSTVKRYYTGTRASAPIDVLYVLRELHRRLDAGEAVVFRSGASERSWVVPRTVVLAILGELERSGVFADNGTSNHVAFLQEIDRLLGVRRGTMERICSNGARPFVRYGLYLDLLRVRDRSTYSPHYHYEVGDRLFHHDFGAGAVVDKRHKNRIIVEFDTGLRLLREDVRLDPLGAVRGA